MARIAIHPGEHLAEELDALKMSAAALARRLRVPTNRVTEILNGQRAITGDTALRLAHFFGTSPEFWLNLQSVYELAFGGGKDGKGDQEAANAETHGRGPRVRCGCPPRRQRRRVDSARCCRSPRRRTFGGPGTDPGWRVLQCIHLTISEHR